MNITEAYYRIFRVRYFSPIFIDAEGTPRRFPLPSKIIKTGDPNLPPYFEYHGFANGVGRYYLNRLEQTKHNGRMSQYYFPDNPFPIPIMTLGKNPMISAEALEKMYNDESIIDFVRIGKEKKVKGPSRLRTLFILVAVMATVVFTLTFFFKI